jgi:histidinol-phosphate/aromatic aminotransferase/cobyric acid decarboxylase-like protein
MSINTEKIAEIIKLSQNENPFGASPRALKAIEEHITSVFRYPDLLLGVKLQHKLAEKHNVAPENIVISAGSVSLIDMCIKGFVGFDENDGEDVRGVRHVVEDQSAGVQIRQAGG